MWVASQGPLFSAGGDRGLYKTIDGGKSWTRVLHVNEDTGISDIVLDSKNPDIVLAGSYQRRRHVGQMIGGGPDGGIWKSINGGKTWTKRAKGLPTHEVGRIALAVDPKKPGRIYALIDAKCAVDGVGRGGGRARRRGGGGGGRRWPWRRRSARPVRRSRCAGALAAARAARTVRGPRRAGARAG